MVKVMINSLESKVTNGETITIDNPPISKMLNYSLFTAIPAIFFVAGLSSILDWPNPVKEIAIYFGASSVVISSLLSYRTYHAVRDHLELRKNMLRNHDCPGPIKYHGESFD